MNLLSALELSNKMKESNRIFLTECGNGYEVQSTKHAPHAVSIKHIFQKAAEQIKDLSIDDFRKMESLVGKLNKRFQEGREKHSIFYRIFTCFCYRGAINAHRHLKECVNARNAELHGITSSIGKSHSTPNFKVPAAIQGLVKATEDMGSLVVMGISKSNKDTGRVSADKVARAIFKDLDTGTASPDTWLKTLKTVAKTTPAKFSGMPASVSVTFVAFRTFPKGDQCRVIGVNFGDNAVCIRKKDASVELIGPPTIKAMVRDGQNFKYGVPALPNKFLDEHDLRYFDVECHPTDTIVALSHQVLNLSIPELVEIEIPSDATFDTVDFKLLRIASQKSQNELFATRAQEKLKTIQLADKKDLMIEAQAQTSKPTPPPAPSSTDGVLEVDEDEKVPY